MSVRHNPGCLAAGECTVPLTKVQAPCLKHICKAALQVCCKRKLQCKLPVQCKCMTYEETAMTQWQTTQPPHICAIDTLMQMFVRICYEQQRTTMKKVQEACSERGEHLQVDVSIGQSIQARPAPLCIVDQQLFHSLYLPQPAATHMHSVAKHVSFSGKTRECHTKFHLH